VGSRSNPGDVYYSITAASFVTPSSIGIYLYSHQVNEDFSMRRYSLMAALICVLGAALTGVADDKKSDKKWIFLDLQPKANQKLKEDFRRNAFPGNNLASLPQGEQTLEGVKFNIGEKLIRLTSTQESVAEMPEKVEGIKVGAKFARLHILHATGWKADDGARIGEYTVNWDDGSSAIIPIEYGKDVLDWWWNANDGEPSRSKAAWTGDNEGAKTANARIRLYLTTWENPKPDKKVRSIDYSTTKKTPAAPFCVAITAEE
jgi:hypothetical protein